MYGNGKGDHFDGVAETEKGPTVTAPLVTNYRTDICSQGGRGDDHSGVEGDNSQRVLFKA